MIIGFLDNATQVALTSMVKQQTDGSDACNGGMQLLDSVSFCVTGYITPWSACIQIPGGFADVQRVPKMRKLLVILEGLSSGAKQCTRPGHFNIYPGPNSSLLNITNSC